MAHKQHDRGMLQAIVAREMVRYKINSKSTPETKARAFAKAAEQLGDKGDTSRARQIGNWMIRHKYDLSEVASRLRSSGRKPAGRKSARKTSGKKTQTPSETQVAA